MVDIIKVKGWVSEYVRLKRMEAKKIEEVYGSGWISDSKYEAANEAEEWLKSNPTQLDEPIESPICMLPDYARFCDVVACKCYTRYKFSDGTIRCVFEFKEGEKNV